MRGGGGEGLSGAAETGQEIRGLDELQKEQDIVVYHAATALKDGKLVTVGGRVLGVTALGQNLAAAVARAYEGVAKARSTACTSARTSAGRRWRACTPPGRRPPMAQSPMVAVLMGSDSDLPTMAETVRVLEGYGVPTETRVLSAHRTPEEATRFAREAEGRGIKVLIAGAGGAAHLAGAMAAHSTLPVIGVPLESSPLSGFDALLSTVQMPPGIPVATVGVGAMGARNAGHLAVAILALGDETLRAALKEKRKAQTADVLGRDAKVPEKLRQILDKK